MSATPSSKAKCGVAAVFALLCLVAVALPAGAASARAERPNSRAQACDPTYGCTTTSSSPTAGIRCSMNVPNGPRGSTVTIACEGVEAGTSVRVLWNGKLVAQGLTDSGAAGVTIAAAGHPQLFDGPRAVQVAQQAAPVSHFQYRVPDVPAGPYEVVLAGPSFNVALGAFTVLANGQSSPVSAASTSSSGSSLAHTGAMIALWILAALAVIVAGYLLNRASKRRHRY